MLILICHSQLAIAKYIESPMIYTDGLIELTVTLAYLQKVEI